jgi:hypothetical protein
MNTGQIKKSKLAGNFTTLPNNIFQDKNLSLKSIGLLCFLLHLPEKWIVNKTRLHSFLKDGRDAVLAAFAELEKFGYIETEEIRDKGRFVGFNYIVSDYPKKTGGNIAENSEKPEPEKPITENPEPVAPITEKPITDFPITEKPITENPALLNTNSIKKEVSKNELIKDEPQPVVNNLFGEPETHKNGKTKKAKAPGAKILPHLFKDSDIFDIAIFTEKLQGTNYEGANVEYYHESANNWSQSGNNKKIDWLATVKNWMARDMTAGKFITKDFKNQNVINGKQGTNGHDQHKSRNVAPGVTVQGYAASLNERFSGEGQ